MSSAAQLRKIKKPLIEKKRRERMNDCLNQLKTLVLEGKNTNSNESRYSKMEKVDILEMTVRYLKELRHVLAPCFDSSQTFAARYVEGYSECAAQVTRYLSTTKELGDDTRQRLNQHLANCLRHSSTLRPPTEPQTTPPTLGFLKRPPSSDPQPSVVPPRGSDCTPSSVALSSSPRQFSTMLTIVPNVATSSDGVFSQTGSLCTSSTSGVIPLYVPASVFPSQNQMTFNPGQPLPTGSLTIPSHQATVPLALLTSSHPALLVVTGDSINHPNLPPCGSPTKGDECPTPFFTLGGIRPPTAKSRSPVVPNNPTESSAERSNPRAVDDRGRHSLPVPVWRPWSGSIEKTS